MVLASLSLFAFSPPNNSNLITWQLKHRVHKESFGLCWLDRRISFVLFSLMLFFMVSLHRPSVSTTSSLCQSQNCEWISFCQFHVEKLELNGPKPRLWARTWSSALLKQQINTLDLFIFVFVGTDTSDQHIWPGMFWWCPLTFGHMVRFIRLRRPNDSTLSLSLSHTHTQC